LRIDGPDSLVLGAESDAQMRAEVVGNLIDSSQTLDLDVLNGLARREDG
jgi:hypothetical protein